jgi:ABC-type amino acid transport substrate-binding protein
VPRSTKVVVASAAAGALALGIGVGVAGLASADPTTTPSANPSVSAPAAPGWGGHGPDGHRGGPGRGAFEGDLAKQLAEKLGVTEADVTKALQEVRDADRPAMPSTAPSSDPSAKPTRPDPAAREAALAKALAEKLGVDEARVTKAFDEIRAARQADRAAELKTRLDTAVKDGTLTQAEADAVTKAVEKGVIGGR